MSDKIFCPECSNLMKKISLWDYEIDNCLNCWWVFLDYWELSIALEKVKLNMNYTSLNHIKKWWWIIENEKKYLCPYCKIHFEKSIYSYDSWVYIDKCKKCDSVYLNKWELKEIKIFLYSLNNSIEWNIQSQNVKNIIWKENLFSFYSNESWDIYKIIASQAIKYFFNNFLNNLK